MGSEKMEPFDVISPKKNSSDYRVYGTQNDWLGPTVSMQKLVLRYWQKCIQI